MAIELEACIKKLFPNTEIRKTEIIQHLWSNYGSIKRYILSHAEPGQVIVKYIDLDSEIKHPRNWHHELGHKRKVKSYQVEQNWYEYYAALCDNSCRVARCYLTERQGQEQVLFLEDLDLAGFPKRRTELLPEECKVVLSWLANFHARFMGTLPQGLWNRGTYWHLETRPEEWKSMPSGPLKDSAKKIDEKLEQARFKTLVHGDAKVANFCFTKDMTLTAAVDFQYVGAGIGVQDVCYFLGSCLDETKCEKHVDTLLDFYFDELRLALIKYRKMTDFELLEQEWRTLFSLAWTDFTRFLMGWMPEHHKINRYSLKLMEKCLEELD